MNQMMINEVSYIVEHHLVEKSAFKYIIILKEILTTEIKYFEPIIEHFRSQFSDRKLRKKYHHDN